ncbi:MAG: hypothetical protein GX613_06030 [Chloroflexi bacterium]|nr:hypothetical protein [Chloroflexota bacterium]
MGQAWEFFCHRPSPSRTESRRRSIVLLRFSRIDCAA